MISFYLLIAAINGTLDLEGCVTNSEPGVSFGGHQLTGQYERYAKSSEPDEVKKSLGFFN